MQDIEKLLSAALREEYRNSTYKEMAKRSGISLSYVHDLVTGKRKYITLSLDKLFALFPDAFITLHGDKSTQSIGDNSSGNIQQIGANVVANTKGDDIRDYQLKVLQAIIGLELDAKAKDAVLTAINQVK